MSRHRMDNGRSDSRFPGTHFVDWNRSPTRTRRDSTYDPLTSSQTRRRESESIRYADRDSGYSARGHQPMMVTYGNTRDLHYEPAPNKDRDYPRSRTSSRYERSDREDRNSRRRFGHCDTMDTPRYSHTPRRDESRSRYDSSRGERTSRQGERRDMSPSMDPPSSSSSRYSSSRYHTNDPDRRIDYTSSQANSVRTSSGRRHENEDGGWPRFQNSCEGRWPFSPDDF